MFRVGLLMVSVGFLLFVVLFVTAASRLNGARVSLEKARASLASIDDNSSDLLTSTGRAHALVILKQAASESANAAAAKNSLSISVLANVPLLGKQVQGIDNLAADVHTASEQGISLLNSVNRLNNASSGTTVSLSALASLQSTVTHATNSLALLETSSGGLIGPIGSARTEFNARVAKIVTQLGRGNEILSYMSTFLGGQGPRNYLLAAENQAEMRDQGAILSVGQIHTVNGHLSMDTPTSVNDYPITHPVDYPIPAGTEKVFGIDQPTLLWQSANLTADFPWSGGDLVAMYRQATGVSDNGVVAIDVHALSGLLSLSGPVSVPGISVPVSSQNAQSLLLNTLYKRYSSGSQTGRKDALAAVARASISRLDQEHVDPASLAHVLATEVAGRHLLVYDAQPNLEAIVRRYGASGAVDTTDPTRTFHLAVENATATKLDYFIATSIHQRVVLLPSGAADVFTTVTVTNNAPSGQAPSYQLGPDNSASHVPGEYVGIVYLWGPNGSIQANGTEESGLEVSVSNIDLLAGQHKTVVFSAVIPHALRNGSLALHWVPQPTIRPQTLAISVQGRGVSVTGPTTKQAVLTTSKTLTWPKQH
jgi:Protein of unknown function (DUF4012)